MALVFPHLSHQAFRETMASHTELPSYLQPPKPATTSMILEYGFNFFINATLSLLSLEGIGRFTRKILRGTSHIVDWCPEGPEEDCKDSQLSILHCTGFILLIHILLTAFFATAFSLERPTSFRMSLFASITMIAALVLAVSAFDTILDSAIWTSMW